MDRGLLQVCNRKEFLCRWRGNIVGLVIWGQVVAQGAHGASALAMPPNMAAPQRPKTASSLVRSNGLMRGRKLSASTQTDTRTSTKHDILTKATRYKICVTHALMIMKTYHEHAQRIGAHLPRVFWHLRRRSTDVKSYIPKPGDGGYIGSTIGSKLYYTALRWIARYKGTNRPLFSSIISLALLNLAVCPQYVSRNCIVNAVMKNRQITKARDEDLGKSRKHKTRADILAAMDLQVAFWSPQMMFIKIISE